MTTPRWDLILVGAGLANGLIAWHLRHHRPELDVLVLEAGPSAGGNHTWSFHASDLTPGQLDMLTPLVAHRWAGYEVRFPAFTRVLPGDYLSVSAERFALCLADALGDRLKTNMPVADVTPTTVRLASGETLHAGAVIDGRGPIASPFLTVGRQAFLGQQWQLEAPHGLRRPRLMDATVDQQSGYRFVYVLPLSESRLLIEDTHYVDDDAIAPARARENIAAYAAAQGWTRARLEREEHGALPITLAGDIDAFWRDIAGQPVSGLRAGLFHPTTGYSLPHAMTLAERIAGLTTLDAASIARTTHAFASEQWRRQRFFRVLNRMLFLAGPAESRWRVMQRFYTLGEARIARFYAGRPTLADKARILIGKPPVPVGEAVGAIMKRTPKLKAFTKGCE